MKPTEKQLVACGLRADVAVVWRAPLGYAMARYDIDTPRRVAAFLAQTIHESQGFTCGREDLNYTSKTRLLQIFGRRIAEREAGRFLRNPEALANRVYANRGGNGDEAGGDGWAFRGGGPVGLTFRGNYTECGRAIGYPLDLTPEMIGLPDVGALSAAWFWHDQDLNALADKDGIDAFDAICDRINLGRRTAKIGDAHGYEERLRLWGVARKALGL